MASQCNICGQGSLSQLGTLPLYSTEGNYMTPIMKCAQCNVIFRDFDYSGDKIKNHFCLASYTDLEKEQGWKTEREQFFQSIVDLSSRYVSLNEKINVLDFGCSYGHMLKKYERYGANCHGIELDDKLRGKLAHEESFSVYSAVPELPGGLKFDIVTFIDSLYYLEDPLQILREMGTRLTEHGIIIIRVTNRRFVIDILYRLLPACVSSDLFGDGKYNFSHRNMVMLFERAGFEVEETLLDEKGKRKTMAVGKRLLYGFTLFVSKVCRIKITPGMIYVVRKNPR